MIASVRRRGFLPAGGVSNADILQYATDELRSYITAFLKGIREEYIITSVDLTVTTGLVNAPVRAVGAAFRTIGVILDNGQVRQLPRIEPENAGQFAGATGDARGYMFQGNQIVLLPAPSSCRVRIRYQQRPGQLVATSACALISSFNTGTLEVTVTSVPTALDPALTGALVYADFVPSTPNFVAYGLDSAVDSVAGSVITMAAALPSAITIGDYMCVAGETCIPQVPTEVHDLLAQRTALVIAQATGSQRVGTIQAAFDALEKQMTAILSPRSDGSARPIVSKSNIGRFNMGGW